jgi:hypothetical protein
VDKLLEVRKLVWRCRAGRYPVWRCEEALRRALFDLIEARHQLDGEIAELRQWTPTLPADFDRVIDLAQHHLIEKKLRVTLQTITQAEHILQTMRQFIIILGQREEIRREIEQWVGRSALDPWQWLPTLRTFQQVLNKIDDLLREKNTRQAAVCLQEVKAKLSHLRHRSETKSLDPLLDRLGLLEQQITSTFLVYIKKYYGAGERSTNLAPIRQLVKHGFINAANSLCWDLETVLAWSWQASPPSLLDNIRRQTERAQALHKRNQQWSQTHDNQEHTRNTSI